MFPDWQKLFAPCPLAARAMRLPLAGLTAPVWFASASSADLRELPAESFLTAAESTRAAAFKFGQPRENFTLGRLAGKLALFAGSSRRQEALLELTPPAGSSAPRAMEPHDVVCYLKALEIRNGTNGEPLVESGDWNSLPSLAAGATGGDWKSPALGVSLSHVNELGVAVAFAAGQQVGLDLELIDARRAETVRKGVPLSAEEEAWLKATSLPETTALLLLWTAREALGKALGCGLACKWETLALRQIEVADGGVFSGRFLHHSQFSCVSWIGPRALMSITFVEGGQAFQSR